MSPAHIGISGPAFVEFLTSILKTEKPFPQLLAIGISFLMVFQALINMGVAVNLLPVTGQPLPLMSMGGTSTWFTCIGLGIILSVSRGIDLENKKETKLDEYAIA